MFHIFIPHQISLGVVIDENPLSLFPEVLFVIFNNRVKKSAPKSPDKYQNGIPIYCGIDYTRDFQRRESFVLNLLCPFSPFLQNETKFLKW